MDTAKLKKFAQYARRSLIDQVTSKLVLVLAEGSAARRENAAAIKKLEEQISEHGKDKVIEKIAYIWFNRFCALRFMDVNRYTRIGLVSPIEGQFQPEILAEAKMGHIDEESVPEKIRQQIFALLGGTAPSQDPQAEAYRLLLVAACNDYHKAMPYLFERIADYTELLMPDDLLSGNSILAYTREAMTPNICQDVEVIGWLYQFYISEKKDKVFDDLKKNKKITPENIPAATQLFTPHWIVRYLVENSLGRLWMLNRPDSKIFKNMKDQGKDCYYIEPSEPEIDFLRINKPEDLKLCDPACGSGHMLVYAFDLLYAIYEEEGVDPSEIPEKILTHNLFGIEIDERAGELAAFALTMKARAKQKRFFRKPVQPNICVLQAIHFDETEINEYMDFVGQDIFTLGLKATLSQFEEADNFGSLIRPEVTNVQGMLEILNAKDVSSHLFYSLTHEKVLQVLNQADFLSPKYHIVIANPPYMGGKGMNGRMGAWVKDNYPDSKSDLFAMFIERNLDLVVKKGVVAMITMQSWMFLSTYGALREKLFDKNNLIQMFHTGPGLFPDLGAFNVLTTNFIICKSYSGTKFVTRFIKANDTPNNDDKIESLRDYASHICIPISNLKSVPDFPIIYWISKPALSNFVRLKLLGDICPTVVGLQTGENAQFIRFWHEINFNTIGLNYNNSIQAKFSGRKWFPYNKGGNYRKWYGNNEAVINWEYDGQKVKDFSRAVIRNPEYYFQEGIVYSLFGFENFGVRYKSQGFIFDVSGSSIFPKQDLEIVLAFLCSNVAFYYLRALAPTVNFQVGDLVRLPLPELSSDSRVKVIELAKNNISLCKSDWDVVETSWDFEVSPLLRFPDCILRDVVNTFLKFCNTQRMVLRDNEQSINEIMIDAYHVENEVVSAVNDRDLSIKIKELPEIIESFISYAVGCMFGRYALDKPGLILANQGETIEDYYKKLQEPLIAPPEHEKNQTDIRVNSCSFVVQQSDVLFPADDDNVIPMLDGDWFTDDVTERFGQFLKVTFGDAHYEENLKFIEQALGKDIRKYFLKDFYTDHLKRYKKRPIYWLFSSPKGTFNALIYMHRYRPDTVSVVLNDYLREFRTKLSAHKNHLEAVSISSNASAGEKTKALKDIENHRKMIDELDVYEREVLYPLATEQIEIDLDDGIKVNYLKFGEALKKIPGLAAKED